mmetsp:Transcript_108278/g.316717  ORF Transcript_108278/g.316717 Transcript_108278/m.316717 type:complete len:428 (-) Transcript_108278:39-1322(-)
MDLSTGRRWLILVSCGTHAFCNQFMFMNFAVVTELAADKFGVGTTDVNWFYSGAVLAAVPCFLCVMAFINTWNWTTSLVGVMATVAAAWLRFWAVQQQSFALALVSSVALGPGTGVLFVGFTDIPVRWFPPGWEQSFSSGVAVQSAFFGWAMGGLIAPILITSSASMQSFLFVQAVVVSLCLPVFLYCQCPTDTGRAEHPGVSERRLSLLEAGGCMIRNRPALMQAAACALLQAVAFTVPAVQEAVFASQGHGQRQCAAACFLFIMAGVALGMTASGSTSLVNPRCLVLTLFWVASVSLCVLELLSRYHSVLLAGLSDNGRYAVYLTLMTLAGASSLGLLNVALPLVCALARPVSEAHIGGAVELLGFGLAAPFTMANLQFSLCAIVSVGAALLMSAGLWSTPSTEEQACQRALTPEENSYTFKSSA